jgi:hypothetical protein
MSNLFFLSPLIPNYFRAAFSKGAPYGPFTYQQTCQYRCRKKTAADSNGYGNTRKVASRRAAANLKSVSKLKQHSPADAARCTKVVSFLVMPPRANA